MLRSQDVVFCTRCLATKATLRWRWADPVVVQGPAAAGDVVVVLGLTLWTQLQWHMGLPPLATQ